MVHSNRKQLKISMLFLDHSCWTAILRKLEGRKIQVFQNPQRNSLTLLKSIDSGFLHSAASA